jgi:hypothetical protein
LRVLNQCYFAATGSPRGTGLLLLCVEINLPVIAGYSNHWQLNYNN